MFHPISCASGLHILTMTKHFSHQARRLPSSKISHVLFRCNGPDECAGKHYESEKLTWRLRRVNLKETGTPSDPHLSPRRPRPYYLLETAAIFGR